MRARPLYSRHCSRLWGWRHYSVLAAFPSQWTEQWIVWQISKDGPRMRGAKRKQRMQTLAKSFFPCDVINGAKIARAGNLMSKAFEQRSGRTSKQGCVGRGAAGAL